MINIEELTKKYIENGYNEIYASAKVAQDIILDYLFKSKYKNNITLKGGIVMYNLTKDKRRATIDIDFDLIRIYLIDDNLYELFTSYKMEGLVLILNKREITDLKHQDYKGKRLPITIKDSFNNVINAKIDVGVHTEYDIKQDELCFNTYIDDNVVTLFANSKEQIFVEKLIPIIKFGLLSTRYKDCYDLYWLIINGQLNNEEIVKLFKQKIFLKRFNNITNINELIKIVEKNLNDKEYLQKLRDRKNNWLEIDNESLKKVILEYLNTLQV